jgi:carbon storage regulator
MLVLSRKAEQQIIIGSDVVLTVMAVKGNRVTIGIKAPNSVRVLRSELTIDDPEAMESQYSCAEA